MNAVTEKSCRCAIDSHLSRRDIMIIARRFNAGSEAEFEKVPKGRMNGPQVLGQFLLPWRVQHQRAPQPDHLCVSGNLRPFLGGSARQTKKGSCGSTRSDVPSGLIVVSHRNPALKRRAIFTQSLPGHFRRTSARSRGESWRTDRSYV
jgi:hypothetical protein